MSAKRRPRARPAAHRSPRPLLTERHAPWIALAVLGLLLLVFFAPIFFSGETFETVDHVAYAAHASFLEEARGEPGGWLQRFPLWDPYVFSGMPAYASLLIGPYITPASMVLRWIPEVPRMILLYLVLALGVWLLAYRLGSGFLAALLAAVVFLFSTQVITLVMFGHHLKLTTLMYLPYLILATWELWNRPTVLRAGLLTLTLGLMLLSAHFQITAYALLASLVAALVATVVFARAGTTRSSLTRRWLFWGGAVVVGTAMAAAIVLPVLEYSASSTRGGLGTGVDFTYATNWSLHPAETLTLISPSWFGYGKETYWGSMPFTDYPFYFGIVPLFLAILAVVLWPRDRVHVMLALLFAIALLLAFGRYLPVYRIAFEAVPLFDKFRVPSMIMLLAGLAIALLAARAADRISLMEHATDLVRVRRVALRLGVLLAAVLVVLTVAAAMGLVEESASERLLAKAKERYAAEVMSANVALPPDIEAGTHTRAAAAAGRAVRDGVATLVVLALGGALLAARLREKVSGFAFLAGIFLLVTADLWRVGARPAQYVPRHDPPAAFASSPAIEFLRADREPYRVFPLLEQGINNNWLAWFRIPNVLGYHPAKIGIYEELIDDDGKAGFRNTLLNDNTNLLDILNVRYVLTDREIPLAAFQLVHRSGHLVYRNTHARPRLWFVDRARVVADPALHLQAVADPAWDPAREALLFEPVGALDRGTGGTARITRSGCRDIEAEVSSPGQCLLVVSEIFIEPGWTATLDGAAVPTLRADYALRAVRVPPGRHVLTMRYASPALRKGLGVSAVGFGLVGAVLLGGFLLGRRRTKAEHAPPS